MNTATAERYDCRQVGMQYLKWRLPGRRQAIGVDAHNDLHHGCEAGGAKCRADNLRLCAEVRFAGTMFLAMKLDTFKTGRLCKRDFLQSRPPVGGEQARIRARREWPGGC
jgi:hypothetical protein